jgi:ectoine hydroxylase-related dioxygenase (phytanoyl-CoA dioxygenase family)
MLLFKDKINYKLPGANGFAAHIDAPAYSHMGDIKHIEVMIAVDAQTLENGCLELVPGSHKTHLPLANGGRLDQSWESSNSFIPIPLSQGMTSLTP